MRTGWWRSWRIATSRGAASRSRCSGAERSIPAGPALLSLTTGAPLIVTPTYTTPDGWRIEIREPLTIEPTGDRRADVTKLTRLMARTFEEAIAAAPADWHMFQPAWQ